jgi:hypothetical protein
MGRRPRSRAFRAVLLAGCLLAGGCVSSGTAWDDDAYGGYLHLFGTETSETTREGRIYVSPGTTFEVRRSRPLYRSPKYVYYDADLGRHVAVMPDGRRYIVADDELLTRYPVVEEEVLRVEGEEDAPGEVRWRERTRTRRGGGGFIIDED